MYSSHPLIRPLSPKSTPDLKSTYTVHSKILLNRPDKKGHSPIRLISKRWPYNFIIGEATLHVIINFRNFTAVKTA